MKNNKIWYLGYVIGICSLILVFAFNLNETLNIILTFVFAGAVSISHVQVMHHKMMEKDFENAVSRAE